jgi:hypothetical protein
LFRRYWRVIVVVLSLLILLLSGYGYLTDVVY